MHHTELLSVTHPRLSKITQHIIWLSFMVLMASLAACGQSKGLGNTEFPTPEAEPCGEGCDEGFSCVPGIDENGDPAFLCVNVHIRFCAPCMEDSDCIDPLMPDAQSVCMASENGQGSFCATDCAEHADCPEGAYCGTIEEGDRNVCLSEAGECECSTWAIENAGVTQCATSNTHGSCAGIRECTEDGLTSCDANLPAAETCNAIDDNCDGNTDETFPEQGESCDGEDTDLCQDGATLCEAGALICADDALGFAEDCNGLDDDCDGIEDNNLPSISADLTSGVCTGMEKVCFGTDGWAEPDYSQVPPYELDEATCDDLDNDCDGQTDESYIAGGTVTYTDLNGDINLVKGNACGAGACLDGIVVCAEDGISLTCSTLDQVSEEVCDGIDNDCDGEVDEGFNAPLADKQDGICVGATKICGAGDGWTEPDYSLIENYEEQEISCDNLDNDCDGEEDELYIEGGLINFADIDGSTLVKGESCGFGACAEGAVICAEDKQSLTCDSMDLAETEICDGLDNDCNMVADDGLTPPEADNLQGVCLDNYKVCGGEEGWLEPDYAVNAGFEPIEASCDDIDNDCNGEIDENYGANGTITFTDTNGTEDLVKGDACGTGVCAGGSVVCADNNLSLACSTADLVSEEVCDGEDNDCNGEVDEGFDAPLSDLQQGVCANQTKVCGAGSGWVEPDYALIAGYEEEEISCDGIDNDCDGEVDELYVAGGPLSYTDLDGTPGLGKGDTCGTGMCMGGTVVCSEDALSLTCNTASIAAAEVCDGEDNDCDGSSDNELTAPNSDLQAGVCAGSVQLCAGSNGWVEPSYASITGYEAAEASCDGIDNDCDGFADNNLTAPNADNQNGACGGAIKLCGGMNGWQEPNYEVMPGYEPSETLCDGVDNDCNGTADDGLTAPVATLQAGACENALKVCSGDTGWQDPDYTLIAGYEVTEVSCDGIDNNCDGGIDTGLDAPAADNQNGICSSSTKVCNGSNGWAEPNYASIGGFEADENSCDGKDNDCDGSIDESLTAPAATKQAGVCVGSVQVCNGPEGWVEPAYTAITGYEAQEVSCDDIDNDCDGAADELFLSTGVVTYTDLNGTPGLSKGQGCGVGSCNGGTVVCAPGGSTLTCSTNDQVLSESCDGNDNDCDGNTDENLSPPVSDNQTGVCVGSVKVCGGSNGWQEPNYSAVTGYEAAEVTCDGLDNNCDGNADNGLTAPDALNQNGICSGAAQVCNGAAGWVEPDYSGLTGYEGTEATCDGDDNDCDGETDEELSAPLAAIQVGVCSGTLKVCGGNAGWVEPNYTSVSQYESTETTCDGQDNDCDGNTDESLTSPAATNQNGACSGASKVCGGVSGWLEPDYSLMTNFEALEVTCDGVDNDCDGTTDNGLNAPNANSQAGVCDGVKKVCGGGAGWQEPNYTATANFEASEASCDGLDNDCDGNIDEDLSAPLATKQDGVCENAVKVCGAANGWQEPDYTSIENYEAEESRCDNRDNDCDGDTDEQFVVGGLVTYTDLNGTANLVKGQSCGVGSCTGGNVVCGDNETTLTCSTLDQVAAETCDGGDNDCDGVSDESLTAPASTLQSGVCNGSVKVCGGSAGWQEPNYTTIANYEATETSCDGVDNDCDGLSDENANPPAADKQSGVCAGQLKVCNGSGGWAEPNYSSIANYEATEISCDSIDNDCDGTADELYILSGSVTYTDLNGTTGLVKGNNCGSGTCAGGSVVCGSDALSLSCTTSGNAGSDICDGNDNDCDGSTDEDFNLSTDTSNCGSCNTTCSYTDGVPACNAGSCELSACDAGYGNCDSNDANGCEVDITSSEDHCGTCGDVCDPDNASGQCTNGDCGIVSCNSGYENCNSSVTDGCEVNTQTDEANCGSCGDVCNPTNSTGLCSSGTCTIGSCDSPYSDCNGSPTDGCEVSLATSITNCGGCGITCTNDHGSAACSGGSCAPSCDALWGSCDGNVNNGCETALNNTTNCGSCGNTCSLANAGETCSSGTCTLTSCNSGYANCDSVESNGCEVNLNTDTSNCGACSNSCTNDHGSTTCSAGTCVPTCAAGWSDCDGDPTNGCETSLNTLTNCQSCGDVCSLANGSESCAGGSCVLTTCDSGYSSCNGNDADGCEIDIFDDTSNCGTCGNTCTNDHGSMVCSSGTCAPSCASGYDNCDNDVDNGCETALNSLSNCGGCNVGCALANASESCGSGVCELTACSNKYCNSNNVTADGCEFNLDTNPGCSGSVTNLGSVNGDINGSTITVSGTGEQWYRVYVDEDSSLIYDMRVRITLTPAAGTDYDLTVHKGSCSGSSQSSSASGSSSDSVTFSWGDSWGSGDEEWMYIQVKTYSANVCSSYTLSVQGDP